MPRKSTTKLQPPPEPPVSREPGDDGDEKRFPPQRGWKHDNRAGVEQLFYSDSEKGIYEAWFKFRDGKPPQRVFDFLKDNGYRPKKNAPRGGVWPQVEWAWARPTNFQTLSQDRLQHERNYGQVVEMMLAEKGVVKESAQEQKQTEGIPF
ncbi:MAG TPA: hypothetical protein VHC22_18065 [Pirellulales bacterium]|nr:hypothetical protein [Pirellulales bacterium]